MSIENEQSKNQPVSGSVSPDGASEASGNNGEHNTATSAATGAPTPDDGSAPESNSEAPEDHSETPENHTAVDNPAQTSSSTVGDPTAASLDGAPVADQPANSDPGWNNPVINDSVAAHEAGWVAPAASAQVDVQPVVAETIAAEPVTSEPVTSEPVTAARENSESVEPVGAGPAEQPDGQTSVAAQPASLTAAESNSADSYPAVAEQAQTAYAAAPDSSAPVVTASEPTVAVARPNYDPAPAYDPPLALRPTAAYPTPEPYLAEPAAAAPEPAVVAAVAPASGIPGGEIYPSEAPAVQVAPIYLSSPVEPEKRGNRLGGSLIALLGTVVFAIVYAAVSLGFFVLNGGGFEAALSVLLNYALTPAFYVPVAFFAVALILLVVIVNRARWWAYVLGGFLVGVVVYAAAILGAMLTVGAFGFEAGARNDFLRSLLMDPLPLSAAIVAREVTVWAGAWISARGRKITAKNAAALDEHNAKLAEAPLTSPTGQPVW